MILVPQIIMAISMLVIFGIILRDSLHASKPDWFGRTAERNWRRINAEVDARRRCWWCGHPGTVRHAMPTGVADCVHVTWTCDAHVGAYERNEPRYAPFWEDAEQR